MRLQLVGNPYTLRSLAAAAQESINVYVEAIEDPNERGKNKAILRGVPGYQLFKNLTAIDAAATPVRGVWAGGGRIFVAAGTKYFEVSSAGALVGAVRTIADDAHHSPVQFFPNGTQLFIVSAGLAYIDNGSGPTQITFDPLAGTVNVSGTMVNWATGDKFDVGLIGQTVTINGVGYTVAGTNSQTMILTTSAGTQVGVAYSGTPVLTAGTGAFLDGCFLVSRPGSRQISYSAINDGSSWSGLDFFLKESWPDNILWIFSDNEQLYIAGSESAEVWQTDPTGAAAFVRLQGAASRTGAVGPFAPANMNGKLYYLGGSPRGQAVAYRLDGFTPVRISTHAVEESMAAIGSMAGQAVSYCYLEDGHFLWVINFTGSTLSWVYDETSSRLLGSPQWHQRAGWSGSAWTPYPLWYHAYVPEWGTKGKHIVGDYTNGNLYEMSSDFYDANGSDIKWRRALPWLYNDGSLLYYGRMELEVDTGESPSGALSIDYDYSDDRGHTWGTPVSASIGAPGDFTTRVVWPFPTGSSRGRIPRFSGSGKAKVCLLDAIHEMEIGAA